MRPLYNSLAHAPLARGSGNAGLWYDKLCDQWSRTWELPSDTGQPHDAARGDRERGRSSNDEQDRETAKLRWIDSVVDTAIGDPQQLAEASRRIHQLVEARGGQFGIFTTESRFVTGLGRSHPIENGFAWHATLGVPYLPGSSVKGMTRAWARDAVEPSPGTVGDSAEDRVGLHFGRRADPRAVGGVIFLDAIPIRPIRLEADVMTPHFTGWTPDKPPGDWRSPVPVPFLVVAPQSSFLFAILPRASIAPAELATVFTWLRSALQEAGAGAKTAVGYGRFAHDEALTTARTQQREHDRAAQAEAVRRIALEQTAQGRWRLALERLPEPELLDRVRIHLEKEPIADPEERGAFARAVAELPGIALWRRGKKQDPSTRHGPDKLKAHARLVDATASMVSGRAGAAGFNP